MSLGYADPELLVADWIHQQLNIKTWADPDLPSNHSFTAPIAHVQRGAGFGGLALTLDDVTLDIDVLAARTDHARETASDIWAAMTLRLPGTTFPSGVFVKLCEATTAPLWTPASGVKRRSAAYRMVLHGLVEG